MIITITSHKGGVGKTTTAIHLAALLSDQRPTLLVDADLSRPALNWAKRAAEAGNPFPFDVIPEKRLVTFGSKYPPESTHLIIDTQGRPKEGELEDAVHTSDLIIVPTETDMLSMATLTGLMEDVQGAIGSNSSKRVGVLLTNVPPLPQKDGQIAREFLEANGFPLFKTQIRSFKCYRTASARGATVEMIRDDSRSALAWLDCESLASEVLGQVVTTTLEAVHA